MRNRRLASSGLRLSRQPRDRPHQLRGVRRQAHGPRTGLSRKPDHADPGRRQVARPLSRRDPRPIRLRGLVTVCPRCFSLKLRNRPPDRLAIRVGGRCIVLLAVREGARRAKAKAKRLPKATDEAYFVRRLRARAGTVVAPGPRFRSRSEPGTGDPPHGRRAPFRHPVSRDRYARELGSVAQAADTSEALATLPGAALLPPTLRRSCSLRSRATGRFREPALRIDPEPPQLARRSQLSHRPQFALAL